MGSHLIVPQIKQNSANEMRMLNSLIGVLSMLCVSVCGFNSNGQNQTIKLEIEREFACDMNLGTSLTKKKCHEIMNQELVVESYVKLLSMSETELSELLDNERKRRATTCPSFADIKQWYTNKDALDNTNTVRSMSPYIKIPHCDKLRHPKCIFHARRLCKNPGCINFTPGSKNQFKFDISLSSTPIEVKISTVKYLQGRWKVRDETVTIGYTCMVPHML